MAVPANCLSAIEAALGRPLTKQEKARIDRLHREATKFIGGRDPAKWATLTQLDKDITTAKEVSRLLQIDAASKLQKAALNTKATNSVESHIQQSLAAHPELDAADVVQRGEGVVHDNRGGTQPIGSVSRSIAATALAPFITKLHALGPKMWGLIMNKEGRNAIIDEAHVLGSSGNKDAKAVVEAWNEMLDGLITRLAAARGKPFQRLSYTYLPPGHVTDKIHDSVIKKLDINGVESNEWVKFVVENNIYKRSTFVNDDGSPMNDATFIKTLTEMSRTLRSEGYSKVDPTQPHRARENRIAQRDHHRRLEFTDAETEKLYRDKYGSPNIVASMVDHVHALARDIAVLERYGPNAEGQWLHIKDIVTADLEARDVPAADIKARLAKLDRLHQEVTAGPQTINNKLARRFAETRSFVAVNRLGSILWNSLPDQAVMRVIAGLNHLNKWKLTDIELKSIASSDYVNALHSLGYGLDTLISQLNRRAEENFGYGISSRMANFLIGSTGHTRVERAGRTAFEATMAHSITGVLPKYAKMADMPDESFQILKNSGMTEQTWAVLRKAHAHLTDVNGMQLITIDSIKALDDATLTALAKQFNTTKQRLVWDAQDQLIGVQLDQSHRAIVTPTENELVSFKGETGTWKGEIWNSIFLFKGFPITQMIQMYHTASGIKGVGKVAYLAAHIASTTVLGYIALQLNELRNGRDPRDSDLTGIEGWRTLLAAMIKGGSLGFYGDFLYAPTNRYNRSFFAGLLGPVAGLAESGINLTQGAATKALIKWLNDEEINVHWTEELIREAKGNIPILGTHWATKPLLDHLIWYNLQEWASPGYISRMKYRAEREYHQGLYVEPDRMLPHRAPDLSKLLPWRTE